MDNNLQTPSGDRRALKSAAAKDLLTSALKRSATGDQVAFEEVYRLSAPKLFGLCLSILSDRQRAEDVIQDVYHSVWRRCDAFDEGLGSAMTWLITIARNRAIDELRRSRHELYSAGECAITIADARPLASDTVEADDEYKNMRRCLDRLSQRDASALRAAFFEGYTYAQLAQSALVPIGTMKSRIRRALLQLRNEMTQSNGEPSYTVAIAECSDT